jgi:hypothetical protein
VGGRVIFGVKHKPHIERSHPRTLVQSDLTELLGAIRSGDDLGRPLGRRLPPPGSDRGQGGRQDIGTGRNERSDTRVTRRNGSRDRLLLTKAGDVTVKIPKLRSGNFFPSIPGAPPTDRSGAVRRGHGGLRAQRLGCDPTCVFCG